MHRKVTFTRSPCSLESVQFCYSSWQQPSMTKRSPWCNQHERSSLSGRARGFHLKSTDDPRLNDTMSFGSPRSPNRPSLSLCHRTRDPEPPWSFRFALVGTSPDAHPSGLQRPATKSGETPKSNLWIAAPLPARSHTNMGKGNAVLPPMLRGKCPELPRPRKKQAQEKPAPPAEHPGRAKSQKLECPLATSSAPRATVAGSAFRTDQGFYLSGSATMLECVVVLRGICGGADEPSTASLLRGTRVLWMSTGTPECDTPIQAG